MSERNRAMDISKLKRWQPKATDIRYMGRCDVCKRPGLYTYRLPGNKPGPDERGREDCGYYCASCGFGNAGSRKYIPD